MEFIDLRAQFAQLEPGIQRRIEAVLRHGQYIMGPEVLELESALADYCGVRHCVSCANGTDALVLALRALDIGPGDAVITTPFTFFATVEAIMLVGARPVFADVDRSTFNLSADALDLAILGCERNAFVPRAVIAVDLFGLPADYDAIEPICAKHGLVLVEDAAQAFGGALGGRRAGSFGSIATTSFFPAKPLGCYGDGGALFTNDDNIAGLLRSLRIHGKGADKYENVRVGTNSRLDTLQAAILLEKLKAFPAELGRRQRLAGHYRASLPPVLEAQAMPDGYGSSWAQFSVLAPTSDDRSHALASLKAAGIPAQVYYPKPLHLQQALGALGLRPGEFPNAEDLADRIFSLPFGPYLAQQDQDAVIACLQAWSTAMAG